MDKSWLLQRLCPPRKIASGILANAHRAFGGEMLGLTDGAWDILDKIWDIEYMGAAEFEIGILPKCLGRMIEYRAGENLIAFKVEIKGSDVKCDFITGDRRIDKRIVDKVKKQKHSVFVLAKGEQASAVTSNILAVAKGDARLKEWSNFEMALQSDVRRDEGVAVVGTCGWIDIQNDFMFFTSEEMWTNTAKVLFDIDVSPG